MSRHVLGEPDRAALSEHPEGHATRTTLPWRRGGSSPCVAERGVGTTMRTPRATAGGGGGGGAGGGRRGRGGCWRGGQVGEVQCGVSF